MKKFFRLKENGTNVSREVFGGLTTFFAMSYIIFVNPAMLSQTGIPWGAVFLATILASVAGTLVMALFANVPYALAPGMGLNAFFTYTVVFGLGFTWQEALGMVFLCGLINVLITVTRIRKEIIVSIPHQLQNAISGGIGAFIAYIGIKNAGFLSFTMDPNTYTVLDSGTVLGNASAIPAIVNFTDPGSQLALIGLIITCILVVKKVKGAILIGIISTTLIGIPMGVVDLSNLSNPVSVKESFSELGGVIGVAVGSEGLLSLFRDPSRIITVLMTIFAFSLSDTFDTLGSFIGTGRQSGIFSEEDLSAMENSKGFNSKLDRALFADSVGTSIGAFLGTSNTTTYVESAAGIGSGARTGLSGLVVCLMFLLSIFIAPIAGVVPPQATAPALIIVGAMMLSSFKEIDWTNLEIAIPAFFTSIFMALAYSISTGIAAGFFLYCIVSIVMGRGRKLHPILIGSTILFILNFILLGILGA